MKLRQAKKIMTIYHKASVNELIGHFKTKEEQ